MKELTVTRIKSTRVQDRNDVTIQFPFDKIHLFNKEDGYALISNATITIDKLVKNDSLLRKQLQQTASLGMDFLDEDDHSYQLYYQNEDMVNCFSLMELMQELNDIKLEIEANLHKIGLMEYEMVFEAEIHNR